ncbi:tetratricopeptide repeat protein [Novosphingobium album (ex Liu et al. 2023)]|uniref:protein O-GlcNAc transferase n=1 Tax=Novosphingobium album (ex Liu et al. 2023) TaxID=3031130 RepID=A0ABT5WXL1_9SPHN|nr:tetratricopeptide repeat protein [Novosphingobium album (ex Liu et al. 2023)]MDE8654591.1 tetratricopeptide repeat protein [Novosphingobium album (ex Liu et al. 2023)]
MGQLDILFVKARAAEKRSEAELARGIYQDVLTRFPANARARKGLAALAAAREPGPADMADLLASYRGGDHAGAVRAGEVLAARWPRSHTVPNLIGAAWLALGDHPAAEQAFRRAIAHNDAHPAGHSNLGIALRRQGRLTEAESAFREGMARDPGHADARLNCASLLQQQGRDDESAALYQEALRIRPDAIDGLFNLGTLHTRANRHEAARQCFAAVTRLQPGHGEAFTNLGGALLTLGQAAEAITAFEAAARLNPREVLPLVNWAKALVLADALPEAIAAFGEALARDPFDAGTRLHKLHQQAQICDFTAYEEFAELPLEAACGGFGANVATIASPFAALAFLDDPARQLRAARAYASATYPAPVPRPVPRARDEGGRIRVGYVTADFHDHATLRLMAGLLREHDRAAFEIRVYSYGPDRDSALRREALGHLDAFTDLAAMGDAEAAALIRADALDIAVDLKGHTRGSRAGLFALGLAPVQIAYLGYPGTMGHPAFDYLVADPVVVPEDMARFYDEKLIRLPASYQPNDDRRAIAPCPAGRAAHGLPGQAFVFCCFNHTYKIGPREWEIWMRLLRECEGSVLWLLRSHAAAEANLRREAAARGVDPARIVFAPKLPQAEHLGRMALADLFLDTFAVNAHTTASDALWTGLPLLTLPGRSFVARVGASLLRAIGLPELIAADESAYFAMARDLAHDAGALAALRRKLAENRHTAPLYDSAGYAHAFEAGLREADRRRRAGLAPDDITLSPPPRTPLPASEAA